MTVTFPSCHHHTTLVKTRCWFEKGLSPPLGKVLLAALLQEVSAVANPWRIRRASSSGTNLFSLSECITSTEPKAFILLPLPFGFPKLERAAGERIERR